MPENDQQAVPAPVSKSPRKKGGGAKVMFVILVVLALAGIIVYLLSLLNSKTFFLVPEGGELVVKKGIFFPVGSEIYQPKSPEQAALYAPIELPDELKHAGPLQFEDLPSLNREFAKYMIARANKLVFQTEEKQYLEGKNYLERLRGLTGLEPTQIDRVKSLGADVNYIEAKRAYQGVEKTLESALKKFKQAETFGTGRFSDSGEWIVKIETLLKAIRITKSGAAVEAEDSPAAPETGVPQPPTEDKASAKPAPAPTPAPTPEDGI
ncbi:MAG TPA: hypothetical protein VM425_00360 [Myxococcota bacterium]|nr:hypothetical protein [Myxococcota bacterium]